MVKEWSVRYLRELRLRLGKKPAKIDKRTIKLKNILKAPLPAVPESFNIDSTLCPIPTPMYANDRFGSCVISARSHQTLRFEAFEQKCAIPITDEEVLNEYWKEGCPLAPWTKPDRGLVMLDSLKKWRSNGWRAGGKDYNIYAFANTDTVAELKAAIYYLGGANIGITLTQENIDQFNGGHPWYVSPFYSPVVGGHDVYICGYDPEYLECITWAKRQKMTWDFFNRACDESYAIIDNRNLWMENSPVDVEKLSSILEEITK